MVSWDDVRRCALALPETEEQISRDNMHWRVKNKLFAWERPLNKADLKRLDTSGIAAPAGPLLGVRTVDLDDKEALLVEDPEIFFTIAHFANYPAVLVRLDVVLPAELAEIVKDAWCAMAPAKLAATFRDRN